MRLRRSFPSFTAFLLNVQYTIGYVAAGFLVSVPIQLLWTVDKWGDPQRWADLWGSLGRGLLCLVPFGALWLFLRYYPWENMRLPEAKLFELQVTRNATLVSFALLLVSLLGTLKSQHVLVETARSVGRPQMLWLLFLLEGVAYVKIKAHTIIFREFYIIEREQHRREWYEELTHGLRAQALQGVSRLRFQAREVRGHVRDRVRKLARWVGADVAPVEEPEPPRRVAVLPAAPCRYTGRFGPARIAVLPAVLPAALQQSLPSAAEPAGSAQAPAETP